MIRVTKINDTELVINSDLIEFVEATPDTMVTLTTGKKIMVRESVQEIIELVAQFKRLANARVESPGIFWRRRLLFGGNHALFFDLTEPLGCWRFIQPARHGDFLHFAPR